MSFILKQYPKFQVDNQIKKLGDLRLNIYPGKLKFQLGFYIITFSIR